MPVTVACKDFPLRAAQVEQLWLATIAARRFADEAVTVRCVSQVEIQDLNATYRGKAVPTNVLTFSYPATPQLPGSSPQHDVPLCLQVAQQEAAARQIDVEPYVALLLVHAYLHITGLDHEKSAPEATLTHNFEQEILRQCGWSPSTL